MTFSVIVGLYQHKKFLPKLIEALEGQMWNDFEVIFCDDGSTDGTKEWFEGKKFKFKHKYLWHKNKGMRLAKSINRGMEAAKGDNFVLIMGDSYPELNYLFVLANYAKPDYLACGVRVQIDDDRAVDIDWRLKRQKIPQDDVIILNEPYNVLTGNGLMFSRKIYEEVGGWNEKIKGYGGDDNEFIARVYYAGYICWSIASAILYHRWHKAQPAVNNDMVDKLLKKYYENPR